MRLSLLLLASLWALPAEAQPVPQTGLPVDVLNQGGSYVVFTEPGAPNVDVLVVQAAGLSGIFRVAEGTTLTELLVLAGGSAARSETTSQFVQTAFVRVLRGDGAGGRTVIYEATPEQMIREPGRHPRLQTGDVIETDAVIEEVRRPVTVLQVIDVASRIASLAGIVFLLSRGQ